jgi:hypothetical protein
MEGRERRRVEKGDLLHVTRVEQPGCFDHGLLVREWHAGDGQDLRRDGEGEGGSRTGRQSGGQPFDGGGGGGVFRGVETPGARRRDQRAAQRDRLPDKLGRQYRA